MGKAMGYCDCGAGLALSKCKAVDRVVRVACFVFLYCAAWCVLFRFAQRLRRRLYQRLMAAQNGDGLWTSSSEPLAVLEELASYPDADEKKQSLIEALLGKAKASLSGLPALAEIAATQKSTDVGIEQSESKQLHIALSSALALGILRVAFDDASLLWAAADARTRTLLDGITSTNAKAKAIVYSFV